MEATRPVASLQEKMSTLEKYLIFLFVLMTGVCVGLVAIYMTDDANSPTDAEGECETRAVYQRGPDGPFKLPR